MAVQLRKVNATTPTALVLRDDVLREVMPHYQELARECQVAEHRGQPKRSAFRRFRSRLAALLKRLEAEPATPPAGPIEILPAADILSTH